MFKKTNYSTLKIVRYIMYYYYYTYFYEYLYLHVGHYVIAIGISTLMVRINVTLQHVRDVGFPRLVLVYSLFLHLVTLVH